MALIFEFKTALPRIRKPVLTDAEGKGSVLFFTGIRYERIQPDEIDKAAKTTASPKRVGPKQTRSVEAHA